MNIASQIALAVSARELGQFDSSTREHAKGLCLDVAWLALLGSTAGPATCLAKMVDSHGAAEQAGLIGFGAHSAPDLAALVNAASTVCALSSDCLATERYASVLASMLMTLGDALDAPGARVLEAIIVGLEVASAGGPGNGSSRGFYIAHAGWREMGLVAGASKLMLMPVAAMEMAFTLAPSIHLALDTAPDEAWYPLHAGRAARDAIGTASLAQLGLMGDQRLLGRFPVALPPAMLRGENSAVAIPRVAPSWHASPKRQGDLWDRICTLIEDFEQMSTVGHLMETLTYAAPCDAMSESLSHTVGASRLRMNI